jgi:hypothetical protein
MTISAIRSLCSTTRQPTTWDEWYKQHRGSTRVEWAREALRRTDGENRRWPFDGSPQREALSLLVARGERQFLVDFHRAALTTRFAVRVEAARAVSAFDKRTAGRLLIREFSSRFQGACHAALRALNELTGLNRNLDCRDPEARANGATLWAPALDAL